VGCINRRRKIKNDNTHSALLWVFKIGVMIEIYFEDKHLVVCKKPYGVLSQKGKVENMIDLLCSQLS
jgi:23S rRNA-/tRNA-specific pseudouridylate synthase